MSYSFNTPCWNCKKSGECKDQFKIQNGINECYKISGEHLGSGSVQLMCTKLESLIK